MAQVKWMACENKGFMVHISNLADVQEKVQVSQDHLQFVARSNCSFDIYTSSKKCVQYFVILLVVYYWFLLEFLLDNDSLFLLIF